MNHFICLVKKICSEIQLSFFRSSRRRGIFKDLKEGLLLQFRKEVRVESTVHDELMPVREGILVTVALWWVSSDPFMFESNSKSVVSWSVANSSSAPWQFQNTLRECYCVFGFGITWTLSHIGRAGNSVVNFLVRMRSGGSNFMKFL